MRQERGSSLTRAPRQDRGRARADTAAGRPRRQHARDRRPGEKVTVDLVSSDKSEKFILDVFCGRIKLSKLRLQNRARTTVILVRLEVTEAPHRNLTTLNYRPLPIHLHREVTEEWAFHFLRVCSWTLMIADQTLQDFMRFCRMSEPPTSVRGCSDDECERSEILSKATNGYDRTTFSQCQDWVETQPRFRTGTTITSRFLQRVLVRPASSPMTVTHSPIWRCLATSDTGKRKAILRTT